MTRLPDETIEIVLNLQKQLLIGIHEARAIELAIFEQYGETEATARVLEQLQNAIERLRNPYSRFCTLLLRIAEEQITGTSAMLGLLAQSINNAQATVEAVEATIQEFKRDWDLS